MAGTWLLWQLQLADMAILRGGRRHRVAPAWARGMGVRRVVEQVDVETAGSSCR